MDLQILKLLLSLGDSCILGLGLAGVTGLGLGIGLALGFGLGPVPDLIRAEVHVDKSQTKTLLAQA